MKYFLFSFLLSFNTFAQDDSYQKQKRQIESVIRYLESKCNQEDLEKRKKECPDPNALDSYRQQLDVINSLISGVENSAGTSGSVIAAPVKTDAITNANAPVLNSKSFCSYETYPTGPVGTLKSGLVARDAWTDAIKKNDLFTMDYRFLEKDIEKLSTFKRDLSCKVDTDCEVLLVSEKLCQFGSDQVVISKSDRELQHLKDSLKVISDMALNLAGKEATAKLCPSPVREYIASCEKCRCELKALAPKD